MTDPYADQHMSDDDTYESAYVGPHDDEPDAEVVEAAFVAEAVAEAPSYETAYVERTPATTDFHAEDPPLNLQGTGPERMQQLQDALRLLTGAASSPNGAVSVKLDARGYPLDIKLTNQVSSITPDTLARQLRETFAAAYEDRAARYERMMAVATEDPLVGKLASRVANMYR